jgi:uncharacterized protein (DUF2461 family)
LIAGGQYSTDPPKLKKIRKEIFDHYKIYKKIITDKKFVKEYKKVSGERNTRLPKGYEAIDANKVDKILIDSLKMKQFYVDDHYEPNVIFDATLIELITKNIKLMYDFIKFLHNAVK